MLHFWSAPTGLAWCSAELDEREFHRLADKTLEHLQDQLDEYVENHLDFGDVLYEVRMPRAVRCTLCAHAASPLLIALCGAKYCSVV